MRTFLLSLLAYLLCGLLVFLQIARHTMHEKKSLSELDAEANTVFGITMFLWPAVLVVIAADQAKKRKFNPVMSFVRWVLHNEAVAAHVERELTR